MKAIPVKLSLLATNIVVKEAKKAGLTKSEFIELALLKQINRDSGKNPFDWHSNVEKKDFDKKCADVVTKLGKNGKRFSSERLRLCLFRLGLSDSEARCWYNVLWYRDFKSVYVGDLEMLRCIK